MLMDFGFDALYQFFSVCEKESRPKKKWKQYPILTDFDLWISIIKSKFVDHIIDKNNDSRINKH